MRPSSNISPYITVSQASSACATSNVFMIVQQKLARAKRACDPIIELLMHQSCVPERRSKFCFNAFHSNMIVSRQPINIVYSPPYMSFCYIAVVFLASARPFIG